MLLLCRILIIVFIILFFIFFILAIGSHDFDYVFFILAVFCFFVAVAFSSLHTCLEDGVVTFEYFFSQYFGSFSIFSSGQSDSCCSCNCGR